MTGPKNATTTRGGSRLYTWPTTGEQFFSVTTILSAIAKPALVNWAAKEVATFAVENRDSWLNLDADSAVDLLKRSPYRNKTKAANLGSAVHKAVEAHTLGVPSPAWPDDVAPFLEQFEDFLATHQPEYLLAEATLYNRSQKMAGTADAFVRMNGKTVLLDYKTGKGVYSESALQLCMYSRMEFVGMPDGTEAPVPQVDSAAILHLRPDAWELIPVRIDDTIWMSALYVREVFRWLEETSKTALRAS